ncbi:hypothetical protein EG242_05905 [Paenimyroides viscosum]|uniref:Carboxypeptidase-like regulatory domain-containing protein n=2 Tax=Paenimyroides viscosum TaxID=2488729 RepID=A0A3P1B2S2_9FLAO|nr:hypothetical protein EG242_05905 [Paenimyroides viscosum]
MSKPHRFFYFYNQNKPIMKNTFLLFVCTLVTQIITAQNINLQISDSETKESIEFATVLLPDYKKSFVSNEKGIFMIDTNKYKLPLKVIVEQFGFNQKEITLQNNTSAYNIFLDPATEVLQELIIPPANAKIKERTYGRTKEGWDNINFELTNFDFSNKDSGTEFGLIINTNKYLKKLKKVNWHINVVTFKKAVFNLQFYEVENNKPSKRIPHSEINFTVSENQKGWLVINTEDLDIFFDGTKKIAAIIKTQKVDFKKGEKEATLIMNAAFTTSNMLTMRSNLYEKWETGPASFPLYITVDSYE